MINTPGGSVAVGTTIAELGSNTITLAQLATLISQVQTQQQNTGGGNIGTGGQAFLALGPGLSGGGPVVGSVPIRLTAPIPAFIFDDGGADGDPGPPGMPGVNGLTGGIGPMGPAVFMAAEDGQDGQDAIPGTPGAPGINGATGAIGPMGPAVFMAAEDGQDGQDAIPGPAGVAGVNGATGASGLPGITVFLAAEDGEEGSIGPPGPAGAGVASVTPVPATIKDLFYWFKADPILASSGTSIPLLQNYCSWYDGNSADSTSSAGGATLSAVQLNSLNAITFPGSGTGNYLLPAGLNLAKATVFLVINPASAAGMDILAGPANCFEVALTLSAGSIFLYIAVDNVAVIAINGTALPVNTWTQANVTYDSSSGAYSFRAGQAAQSSGTSVHAVAAASTAIAYNPVTGASNFNGQIAEMIIYGRALTLTEVQSVETYLHSKWNV